MPARATARTVGAAELGIAGSSAFFVSVAAVDAQGHESLFAYPGIAATAPAAPST